MLWSRCWWFILFDFFASISAERVKLYLIERDMTLNVVIFYLLLVLLNRILNRNKSVVWLDGWTELQLIVVFTWVGILYISNFSYSFLINVTIFLIARESQDSVLFVEYLIHIFCFTFLMVSLNIIKLSVTYLICVKTACTLVKVYIMRSAEILMWERALLLPNLSPFASNLLLNLN